MKILSQKKKKNKFSLLFNNIIFFFYIFSLTPHLFPIPVALSERQQLECSEQCKVSSIVWHNCTPQKMKALNHYQILCNALIKTKLGLIKIERIFRKFRSWSNGRFWMERWGIRAWIRISILIRWKSMCALLLKKKNLNNHKQSFKIRTTIDERIFDEALLRKWMQKA